MWAASSGCRKAVQVIGQCILANLRGPACRAICSVVLLVAARMAEAGGDRQFLQPLTLADGTVVVVEEGALEPRSIGSFSIRLYSGVNPTYPFDDFISGIVIPRDGTVERLVLADIDGDDTDELIVIMRSVGSGSYQSAKAFAFSGNRLNLISEVDNLQPELDPIEWLRR